MRTLTIEFGATRGCAGQPPKKRLLGMHWGNGPSRFPKLLKTMVTPTGIEPVFQP